MDKKRSYARYKFVIDVTDASLGQRRALKEIIKGFNLKIEEGWYI